MLVDFWPAWTATKSQIDNKLRTFFLDPPPPPRGTYVALFAGQE